MTRITRSEAETQAVGRELARDLEAGTVLLLSGDLGAGKTAFVKGLAHGLGIPAEDVTSPTFTLIQEYRGGRLPLYHIDLYRLSPREVDDLGLDDLMLEGGVMAVEWPERWLAALHDAVRVELRALNESERAITIERPDRARRP